MEDAILYWNDVSLEANKVSHNVAGGEQRGPTLSSRALAITHLAMYDAFAGVLGNPGDLPPYLNDLPPAPVGAAVDAAVAGAAHTALSALFPSQKPFFDTKRALAPIAGTAAQRSDGLVFGAVVAETLLAHRSGDPDASSVGYTASTARGAHRVDPDNPGQGYYSPYYGSNAKCFAVSKRHALDKPPIPSEVEYLDSLRQVRAKGIIPELTGTLPARFSKRTVDETLMGIFWAYDGTSGIGTPPRLYNQIVRQVAIHQGNTTAENARLFALVNAALADAGILSWEQKYIHNLWRPVL
ncbi:MAG TPA: chloroperoxidase, partial [Gammaproteobacteria bacterium]|nr:chloroperoxidase [Gammaproteobacteria bacterium]